MAAAAVLAVDLDADGDPDVLSASRLDDTIAWYENDGTPSVGAWPEHAISTTADTAVAVFAADLDGDGDVDVLSAASAEYKVAWYENDGTPAVGSWPEHVISTNAAWAYAVFGDWTRRRRRRSLRLRRRNRLVRAAQRRQPLDADSDDDACSIASKPTPRLRLGDQRRPARRRQRRRRLRDGHEVIGGTQRTMRGRSRSSVSKLDGGSFFTWDLTNIESRASAPRLPEPAGTFKSLATGRASPARCTAMTRSVLRGFDLSVGRPPADLQERARLRALAHLFRVLGVTGCQARAARRKFTEVIAGSSHLRSASTGTPRVGARRDNQSEFGVEVFVRLARLSHLWTAADGSVLCWGERHRRIPGLHAARFGLDPCLWPHRGTIQCWGGNASGKTIRRAVHRRLRGAVHELRDPRESPGGVLGREQRG
jgi:hypothetical protein